MAERIIRTLPRDERIPEQFVAGYESFAIAHMVIDNPEVARFCNSGYPNARQARDLVKKCEEIYETHIASKVAP